MSKIKSKNKRKQPINVNKGTNKTVNSNIDCGKMKANF